MLVNGKLVILSGPSGVGKDTLIDAWREINPRVERVVAYTTRAPRPGEVDGTDYHFVSVPDFQTKASNGDFLEFKEVHGNWYATPLTDMEQLLLDGKIAILKIDVQGALHAMTLRKDALSVFILPPSMEELENRIRGRGTDDPAVIEKRLTNAQEEVATASKYQHRIVNLDVELSVSMLEQIIQ
jgi:guanylate kinase